MGGLTKEKKKTKKGDKSEKEGTKEMHENGRKMRATGSRTRKEREGSQADKKKIGKWKVAKGG